MLAAHALEAMSYLQELSCPNCGAPLPAGAFRGTIVDCKHCGTSFRTPVSLTPEPEMGDLLLGADFRDTSIPGWTVFSQDKLEFRPGSPAELWVRQPASDRNHAILRSPGPLDDCDLSVSLRFIEGKYTHVKAGFEVRSCDAGDYILQISAQGTYRIGWHDKLEWGGELLNWTEHPSLRKATAAANRLRVILRGEQMRVYLNGVLATSLRDSRFNFGFVRLVVSPGGDEPMVVAFSDLQLREARPG